MSDNDKPGRGKNPPGDHTVFRKDDATRRPPAKPEPGESTVIRPGHAGGKQPAGTPAGDAATRIRPPANNPPRAVPPEPSGSTRVRPRAPSGQSAHPNVPHVEQHQVLKGRFTLEKVIGVGGMGVVYKAKDRLKVEAHDREPYVAIKVLSEEFKSHPESFIALQRESRKTQRISHPSVVRVFDFDRDGDIVFMTMEYMQGRPLDEIIKQYSATGLPPGDAWSILNGLCSALTYAHEEHIVHSDFKPGNIFITDSGMAKVFDFGIARAVANVDRQGGKTKDVTVFDAGTLGALTPAYASLEMLNGEQPDVRDDLYALGVIAYEILTGEHPFGRLPADEAMKRGLKPKKIPGIKRRQWRAIEQAMAFKRADRIASARKFHEEIQPKAKPTYILGAALAIILAIALATYFIVTLRSTAPGQQNLQLDEIEFGIRYNLHKEKIEKLLRDPSFTDNWESTLWEEYSALKTLLNDRDDKWFNATGDTIYQLYINTYKEQLAKENFKRAEVLLTNAYRYAKDTRFLDEEKARLAALMQAAAEKLKADEEARNRVTAGRQARQTQTLDQAKRTSIFELALRNVNQQLQCDSNLNMREFGVAVEKLRDMDAARYQGLEKNIVTSLAGCIVRIGKTQPERAHEAKNYALRIFPNNSIIAGINIKTREACDKSLAGLGARGESAFCRDKLTGNLQAPTLVVIPAAGNIQAFAIGKYEVSVKEFNQYCTATNACRPTRAADDGVPVTGISAEMAIEYTRWLSRSSSHPYRLPTRTEWMHAANATSRTHDPNRNCSFSTHGIEKGGQVVRTNAGTQNSWGLVNYLGNSQEWTYDKNRNLVAVGGSFEDNMAGCNVESFAPHTGKADHKTGFRVLREIGQ